MKAERCATCRHLPEVHHDTGYCRVTGCPCRMYQSTEPQLPSPADVDESRMTRHGLEVALGIGAVVVLAPSFTSLDDLPTLLMRAMLGLPRAGDPPVMVRYAPIPMKDDSDGG